MIDYNIGLDIFDSKKTKNFYEKLCETSIDKVINVSEDEQYKKFNEDTIRLSFYGDKAETFLVYFFGLEEPLICTFRTKKYGFEYQRQAFAIIKNDNVLITGSIIEDCFEIYDKIQNYLFNEKASMKIQKQNEITSIIDDLMSKL